MNLSTKDRLIMSSREIAKLTNKRHLHVKRDCLKMFIELDISPKGYIQNWIDPQNGQTYTEYILPKLLIETLITGYSLKLRYWVIQRLHELEITNKYLQEQLNSLLKQYSIIDSNLSDAGRFLNVGGKQLKPLYKQKIEAIIQVIQPDLFVLENDKEDK